MRNYESRFRLPNGKWAYIQRSELVGPARQQMKRVRKHWTPPDYFFHLRQGGHVAALKLHQPNSWYGKIDLSRFFSHVHRHRLIRCLKNIGYSFQDADDFAVASTVCVDRQSRRFALPFGFVQSPLLASLALDESALGSGLKRIHRRGIALSVYVDDIIVSADDKDVVGRALDELRDAAARSNFRINEEKSRGPAESLQAFNISMSAGATDIVEDRFEEMCRDVLQSGAGPVSDGILSYVRSVSAAQAEHMLMAYPDSFDQG